MLGIVLSIGYQIAARAADWPAASASAMYR